LFDAVKGEFELDAHELELLNQAAHVADLMDALQKHVDRDGVLSRQDFEGAPRPHPALSELRAQRSQYMQLIRMLGLPTGVTGESAPARTRVRATAFEMGKLRGLPGGVA
jgi:hypothetical protein